MNKELCKTIPLSLENIFEGWKKSFDLQQIYVSNSGFGERDFFVQRESDCEFLSKISGDIFLNSKVKVKSGEEKNILIYRYPISNFSSDDEIVERISYSNEGSGLLLKNKNHYFFLGNKLLTNLEWAERWQLVYVNILFGNDNSMDNWQDTQFLVLSLNKGYNFLPIKSNEEGSIGVIKEIIKK